MFKNVVGYCRYSKKEYENVYTIEQQKEAIKKFALENGYGLIGFYEDVNRGGRKFNRRGLNELLKFLSSCHHHNLVLVSSDVSRLFTKLDTNWYSLKKFLKCNGVKFISLVHHMDRYTKE